MGRYKGGGKTPSEKLGGRCAGDLTILQVRSGFAPISAHLIFEEHFLPIFFGRQAIGNGVAPSSVERLLDDSP